MARRDVAPGVPAAADGRRSPSSARAAASPAPSTRSAACARSRTSSTAAWLDLDLYVGRERRGLRDLAAGQRRLPARDVRRGRRARAAAAFGRSDARRSSGSGLGEFWRALAARAPRRSPTPSLDRAGRRGPQPGATWPGPSSSCCPRACSTTRASQEYLAALFATRGRTNDFARLPASRYIVIAVDLDSGEAVAFGDRRRPRRCRSRRAVQASTALPGLYRPVRIGGRDYVDGGVKKTAHINLAIRAAPTS